MKLHNSRFDCKKFCRLLFSDSVQPGRPTEACWCEARLPDVTGLGRCTAGHETLRVGTGCRLSRHSVPFQAASCQPAFRWIAREKEYSCCFPVCVQVVDAFYDAVYQGSTGQWISFSVEAG